MSRRTPNLRTGQPVRIDGHVADADGSMHGCVGHVVGANHTERGSDGVQRTLISTRDGQTVAVPTAALRPQN